MDGLFVDTLMTDLPTSGILLPERTALIKVREGSDSLKTTIPPGVRSFLDLKPNEELVWEISMDGRQKIVKVTKG